MSCTPSPELISSRGTETEHLLNSTFPLYHCLFSLNIRCSLYFSFFLSFFLFFFVFLGLYPRHMEVPRIGVLELGLQLLAYTTISHAGSELSL